MKPKLLSIYLPQFHRIPENDLWWGEGFTEWTNVKRGKPYYKGHYQPREPLHDDYYDLSNLKVLERHTRIAQKAGISGFCFYHYYFKGKKLLEKPIEQYRDYSKEGFPYCLIWANQSWARTWYRTKGNQTLLQQTYGEEIDWRNQFEYLLTFFKDDRYIKVDNKPVYIIYLPQDIACRRRMFAFWNKLAVQNGFAGIYLIAMNTSYGKDEREALYSAYMNFEPLESIHSDQGIRKWLYRWKQRNSDKIKKKSCFGNRIYMENAYSYAYLCKKIERIDISAGKKTYAGIFPGWDNTSRKDEAGYIITGSTPKRFALCAKRILRKSAAANNEFVFINAWNEWSEGAYLEPDKKYGYAYLNALRRALRRY